VIEGFRKFRTIRSADEEDNMLDVIFMAATALFFTVGVFYVRGCERLK